MALTSINMAVANGTFFTPIPTITAASFSSPTYVTVITNASIIIGSVTGNFTSYIVGRTGGSQGTFTSTSQTGASYTDPTTLTANVQYTYTITPYIGGIAGNPFTNIVNPNNGSTPGKIYTLASPPTLAYSGATSSTSQISFTFAGGSYTNLSVQFPLGTFITATTTSPYTGGSYSANTQNTYYVYAINGDSYGGLTAASTGTNVTACSASVSVCTLATANTPTFSGTGSGTTTLGCIGAFSSTFVTYSPTTGNPASGSAVSTSSANTISQVYNTLNSGVTYTFNVYPVNALSYPASATGTNFTTNTVAIPVSAVITAASFSSPTALGQIVISSITGTFTSFTVSRTGGSQGAFTSTVQTFTNTGSYTDPTSLTANTQYTYTITPTNSGTTGSVFTAITNPKTGTTAGTIYTLASPATLALTYAGATSTTTAVSFTWIGTANNFATLSIQTSTSAATGVLSTPAYNAATQTYTTGASYTANQSVTLYVFAVNVDGIGSGVAAAQGSVSTCTWGSCNAPTFSSTTATGTTLACGGTFSKVYITYSGAGSPASGTTVTGTNTITQAYTTMTSNTAYTFVCYPINALDYLSSNSASAGVSTSAAASSGRVWVAVGQGSDTTTVGQGILWTTTPTVASSWVNALSYNPATYPAVNEQFQDVECNRSTGTFVAGSNAARMYRSTDGKNWTSVAVTSATFRVRYFSSVNIWIAISGGLTYIVSTNDGVTWSSNYTTNIHNNLYDFATNGSGRWVCCGYIGSGGAAGPILSYSDHGNNFASASWNAVFTSFTAGRGVTYTIPVQNIQTVIYFNGYFSIIVNSTGYQPYQMYSTDGVNWTISNPTSTVAQNNNRLVIDNANNRIFGTNISVIIVSNNNGIGWTRFGNALAVTRTYSMAYADNTLVAVTGNTATYGSISYSTDNWATAQPLYFSAIMKGVAYNNG
jgi:hypothetical protein